MSFAPRNANGLEGTEPAAGLDDPIAPDELSRNVLGIIGAYRMGAALDTAALFPPDGTSASSPRDDQSPVRSG